ncbi:FtsX-like permease family protein [Candidatus Kaiserbacteria bacterium]|nr:MAG: FtsX-like permease family protein [Candidatus Kaiserbacteria bacterium]
MLNLRIGLFLGLRQMQHTNPWTTILIIIVIVFTFLNLVVVSGILSGIVDGAMKATRSEGLADIIINPLAGESAIKESARIFGILDTFSEIQSYSPRYTNLATIEANYKERRDLSIDPDIISITMTGINPVKEAETVAIESIISEGEYFKEGESGYIILGKYAIDRYAVEFGSVFPSLENVYPGDTVRVTAGDRSEEFVVKGIIDSKIDLISFSMFMPEKEFRRLFGRDDHNVNQIIVRLKPGEDEDVVKKALQMTDIRLFTRVETFTESLPKYILDVSKTFDVLGLFVGVIGIIVASITIFIIIFINALSRRRQIGILKAIGMSKESIEYAYVIQAGTYTIIGAALGLFLTYFFLIPYFIENPIDFPYSYVSLSLTDTDLFLRAGALICVTLIAGFVPAWLITRQNTLNAVLGRK